MALSTGEPSALSQAQAERSARLAATLAELTAPSGRQGNAEQWAAAKYLAERFAALGYRTHIEDYSNKGKRWPNVVAVGGAPTPRQGAVLLMAHLDSISGDRHGRAPGADDNGSGIAVLLELARTLRDRKITTPVVFAVFSNEETDRSGSRTFASRLRQEEVPLRAVINVDVVGYPRPRQLLELTAFSAHHTWRGRFQALREQIDNIRLAFHHGPQALKVVGHVGDRPLTAQVAKGLATSGLEVVPRTRQDGG